MSIRSSDTTTVEIDSRLLDALRALQPGMEDRKLVERLIIIEVGRAALRASQRRSNLSEEEANELAVRAVREVRAERR